MKVRIEIEGTPAELGKLDFNSLITQQEGHEATLRPPNGASVYSIGERVEAEWASSNWFYSGVVADIRDGMYYVEFDDSDASWVPAEKLRRGKPKEEPTAAIVEKALTRRPLSKSQDKVLNVILAVEEPGLTNQEIATKAGLGRQELAGVLGALGRRFANTEGWPQGASAFGTKWDPELGQYRYWALPVLTEAFHKLRSKDKA